MALSPLMSLAMPYAAAARCHFRRYFADTLFDADAAASPFRHGFR